MTGKVQHTPAARQEWRSTFKFFDRDNSGAISEEELYHAFRSLGQEVTRDQIRNMMHSVGCAAGEELDFDRYTSLVQTYFSNSACINRAELKAIYDAVDIDLSGYLTAAELRHFMTLLHVDMSDEEVAEMVSMYDVDGDNRISSTEFEKMLTSMGYAIVESPDVDSEEKSSAVAEGPHVQNKTRSYPATGKKISLSGITDDALEALQLFDYDSSGVVSLGDLQQAADMLKAHLMRNPQNPEEDPGLHWDPSREKRGLGDLVYKANHIAIIVSDVGRSAKFYSDILGLQQIRRPNFDKHGAWFTMGNVELHLIKGVPLVHSGDDLIVNHVSIETYGIDLVPERLRQLGVPFRQNVSVPKGEDGGAGGKTNADKDSAKIVRQFFFRDPDGYYIEVCNCMLLTEYCLGKRSSLEGYNEAVQPLSLKDAALTLNVMKQWAAKGQLAMNGRESLLEMAKKTDGSFAAIASLLECTHAEDASEDVVEKFKIRQTVYGDICQSFTVDELEQIVRVTGNDAHAAFEVMQVKAELDGRRTFQPPAFFEGGNVSVLPPVVPVSAK